MIIEIPSNRKSFIIKLKVRTFEPLVLGVKAYDPTRSNAHYLRRKVTLTPDHFEHGDYVRTIEIPLPVSPKRLALEIKNKGYYQEEGFEVEDLEIEKMPFPKVWATPEHHRFMEFAIQFAQKSGDTPTGFYASPDDEFLIQYLPTITDQYGEELVTPARISRTMPRVQLSKRLFKQFSIPIRVAILAHEGCHYFKNTRSEKVADLCGIKYYLDANFPDIEAVYATTKVFKMHSDSLGEPHVQRVKDVINFIDQYRQKAA